MWVFVLWAGCSFFFIAIASNNGGAQGFIAGVGISLIFLVFAFAAWLVFSVPNSCEESGVAPLGQTCSDEEIAKYVDSQQ